MTAKALCPVAHAAPEPQLAIQDRLKAIPIGVFGASLSEFDINLDLNDRSFIEIEKLFYESHLLVLRGQSLPLGNFMIGPVDLGGQSPM